MDDRQVLGFGFQNLLKTQSVSELDLKQVLRAKTSPKPNNLKVVQKLGFGPKPNLSQNLQKPSVFRGFGTQNQPKT